MMKKARWMLLPLAAIFFVPCAWAAVQVVDVDGTIYSVGVVESGRGQSSSAALSYSVIRLGRTIEVGWVAPVAAHGSDRDPSLMLVPGVEGPALVWGRKDGA